MVSTVCLIAIPVTNLPVPCRLRMERLRCTSLEACRTPSGAAIRGDFLTIPGVGDFKNCPRGSERGSPGPATRPQSCPETSHRHFPPAGIGAAPATPACAEFPIPGPVWQLAHFRHKTVLAVAASNRNPQPPPPTARALKLRDYGWNLRWPCLACNPWKLLDIIAVPDFQIPWRLFWTIQLSLC